MEVLFVSHEASATGAPIFFVELIKELQREYLEGLKVNILLIKGGEIVEDFKSLGETLELFKVEESRQEEVFKSAYMAVKFDFIYYNTLESAHILKWVVKNKIPTKKNVFHIHELEGIIQRYGGSKRIQVINDFSDSIITVSRPVHDNLVNNHGFDSSKMKILPPFTKEIRKYKQEDVISIKEKLGLVNKKIILGCGDINARKGVDFFVNLAKQYEVKNKHFKDRLHFIWLGPDTNKEMKFYEKELEHFGIENFTFLGFQKNTEKFFNIADVFVMCSREDPHPLVCMEAASIELPVMYFKESGGISTFFREEGFDVPFLNVEVMLAEIKKITENSEDGDIKNRLKVLKLRLETEYNVSGITDEIVKYI